MARNEFLASISHELRTPLTYIKGYDDIINSQDTSEDEVNEVDNSITKLSKDLKESKMARNEFLVSIPHELRTPLTYIKEYADIINRPDTSEEEVKEYVDIIREETEQLTALIKNLFQL